MSFFVLVCLVSPVVALCGTVNCTVPNYECVNNVCVCAPSYGGPFCGDPRFRLNDSIALFGSMASGSQAYYELPVSNGATLLTFEIAVSSGNPLVR